MGSLPITPALPTELQTLLQIARTVARGDDAESRIHDILRHLAVSHGLLRGRVLIADPAAGQIYVRYAHGLTAAEMERGRFRIGEGVSGQVFETGAPALVPDVHEESAYLGRIVPRESLPSEPVAFLVVPVVRHHLPIGVLAALRPPNTTRPVQSDQAVMEVVAMLIAQILCAAGETLPCNCAAVTHGSKVVALPTVPVDSATGARRELPPTPVPIVRREELRRHSRDMALRVARQRHGEGRLHMAAALYLKVAEYHPGSAEAQVAASRLLEIVGYHERQGNNRLAEDVLKRLDRVLDGGHCGSGEGSGFGSWEGFGGSGGIGAHPL